MKQIVDSPSIFGFIKLSRLLVKVAPRQRRAGSRACLRAAAHRVGHFVAGNAVPIAEFLKLLEAKLFGIGRMLEWVILGAIVLLTAVSRVYVRAHWPIDVLASTLVA